MSIIESKEKEEQNCYYWVHYARRWIIHEKDVTLAATLGTSPIMEVVLRLLDSK